MLPLFTAWTEHTESSRAFAEDYSRALERSGLSRKQAADYMRTTVPELTKMLSGERPLNLWKAADLPWEFHMELFRLRMRRIGGDIVEPGEMRDMVTTLRTWLCAERKESA